MPYLFSPSKLAFFHTDVPCHGLPEDVVEVADDAHGAIMEGLLLHDKVLQADIEGGPVAAKRSEEPAIAGDGDEELPNRDMELSSD